MMQYLLGEAEMEHVNSHLARPLLLFCSARPSISINATWVRACLIQLSAFSFEKHHYTRIACLHGRTGQGKIKIERKLRVQHLCLVHSFCIQSILVPASLSTIIITTISPNLSKPSHTPQFDLGK